MHRLATIRNFIRQMTASK